MRSQTHILAFRQGDLTAAVIVSGQAKPEAAVGKTEENEILPGVLHELSRLSYPVTRDYVKAVLANSGGSLEIVGEVSRQISFSYVETYLRDYDGTIATGLTCGLKDFDYLSRSPVTHCLAVWRALYTELGIYPACVDWSAQDIIMLRECNSYRRLIRAGRKWFEQEEKGSSRTELEAVKPWRFVGPIRDKLRKIAVASCRQFDAGFERMLGKASQIIERQSCALPSSQVSNDRVTVRLDVKSGTLRFSDNRRLSLNAGQVAVLSHLAESAISFQHAGVAGQLTDREVASLYGPSTSKSNKQATESAYQFARLLRRELRALGIVDTKGVIRRMHGGGIALGNMWPKKLRQGSSEVGLITWIDLGPRSDIGSE